MSSLKKTDSYAESTKSTNSTIASIKSKTKSLGAKLKGKSLDKKLSTHANAGFFFFFYYYYNSKDFIYTIDSIYTYPCFIYPLTCCCNCCNDHWYASSSESEIKSLTGKSIFSTSPFLLTSLINVLNQLFSPLPKQKLYAYPT